FQTILENTPPQGGELKQDSDVWLSITSLLPEKRGEYYTLAGSLTTPPCSEGVDWYVLTDTTEISETQLDRLKSFFSGNARLKQELNNRAIAKKK
ncbi:MAG TPA: carbonic anhydrase family protein, partial [Nitrosomonas sp.]|nr:carbonic anhydrase family protein [Nitrosomonas sp.]